MIRLVLFLVVAVGLSWLATWFADHPGQVSLTWRGTQIETSVAVLLVGIALVGVFIAIGLELLRWLRGAPRKIGERRRRVRQERGYQALAQGMVAAAAGDGATAKQLARRADKMLDHAPATLLLGAQTAQMDGDEGTARIRFEEMLKHPETEFLGLRGLLAQAMKDGDRTTALKLARRAQLRRPETPWVLTTLFDLQSQAGLWNEALSTVADMARHKMVDAATATRRRAILFHQQAGQQRDQGRPYEALFLARKAHKLQSDFAPIAVQASKLAQQTNQPRVARKILETAWKARPHPAIAQAYLDLDGEQPEAERFKQAERLHQLEPSTLESELMLAERAVAARRWDTARSALQRALKLEPSASVYQLLAEVEQADGKGDQARAWLARAVDAPADSAWRCETTGEVRRTWSPFGPDGRFDSLRWGPPPKIVPLLRDDAVAELIPPSLPAGSRDHSATSTAGPSPAATSTTTDATTEPGRNAEPAAASARPGQDSVRAGAA